jgi:hypothetical protein
MLSGVILTRVVYNLWALFFVPLCVENPPTEPNMWEVDAQCQEASIERLSGALSRAVGQAS